MRKTMTLAALAKELGLSESAVSKALNDYPDISPATKKLVREQAEAYGHSEKRELAFLVAHSMLHLFGYDHMEDEERKIMEAKQEEILKLKGYTR